MIQNYKIVQKSTCLQTKMDLINTHRLSNLTVCLQSSKFTSVHRYNDHEKEIKHSAQQITAVSAKHVTLALWVNEAIQKIYFSNTSSYM